MFRVKKKPKTKRTVKKAAPKKPIQDGWIKNVDLRKPEPSSAGKLSIERVGDDRWALRFISMDGSSTIQHVLSGQLMETLATLLYTQGFSYRPLHYAGIPLESAPMMSLDQIVEQRFGHRHRTPRPGEAYDIVPPEIAADIAKINRARQEKDRR